MLGFEREALGFERFRVVQGYRGSLCTGFCRMCRISSFAVCGGPGWVILDPGFRVLCACGVAVEVRDFGKTEQLSNV